MSMRYFNNLLAKTLLVCLVIAGVFCLSQGRALAISDILPDPSQMNGAIFTEVSRTGNNNGLNAPTNYAKVYFNSASGGTVYIWDADHCRPSAGGYDSNTPAQTTFGTYVTDSNENMTTFPWPQTYYSNAVNQPMGSFFGAPVCGVKSIAVSGLTASVTHPGMFVAVVIANHNGLSCGIGDTSAGCGGVNAFKYSVMNSDGSKALIGNFSDASQTAWPFDPGPSYSFLSVQDRVNSTTSYNNFKFEFAPDCTWGNAPKTAWLKWRDDDWGTLQSNPSFQTVLSEYTKSGTLVSQRTIYPRGGNGAFQSVSFNADSNHYYTWEWQNVIKTNGVQMYMPFASIDVGNNCSGPQDVSPTGWIEPTCNGFNLRDAEDPDRPDIAVSFGIYYSGGPYIGTGTTNAATNSGSFDLKAAGVPSGSSINVGIYNYRPDGSVDNTKATWISGFVWSKPFDADCVTYSFTVTPTASITLNDPESPSSASFDTDIVVNSSGVPVKGGKIVRSYYIKRGGSTIPIIPAPSPSPDNRDLSTFSYPTDSRPISATAGDQICVSITVEPGTGVINGLGVVQSITQASVSDEACQTIYNKPYVSFYGNDVSVGGDFAGGSCVSATNQIDTYYDLSRKAGSNVQLAAFAIGAITEFASASQRTASPLSPTGLSFANTPAAGTFGGSFGGTHCINDYFADSGSLTPDSSTTSVNLAAVTSDQLYTAGTVRMSGIVPDGRRLRLFVDGDLIIDNNISYASASWTSLANIPALRVVVRGNIRVTNNVSELTGHFVSQPNAGVGGSINTCTQPNGSPWGANDLFDKCQTQLVINGAFTAKQVYFSRTANSLRDAAPAESSTASKAAEVFRFSPEAFLTPFTPTITSSQRFDYYTMLPPLL